eukprot:2538705-Ditylum_brightwellii.AAC.1
MRAALLFWENLSDTLQEWGFKINLYNWCVANKEIEGSQCTIVWHVDDLKISHVNSEVVTELINKIQDKYGKEKLMTVTRGKILNYLGMNIDFMSPGKVMIDTIEYVIKMLLDLPPEFDDKAAAPAANHLFITNEQAEKLDEEKAQLAHHNIAKFMFLCQQAQPDTQTSVAFLSTRVKSLDTDNWKKLI